MIRLIAIFDASLIVNRGVLTYAARLPDGRRGVAMAPSSTIPRI